MKIDNDMLSRALDKIIEQYIKENDLEKVRHGKWKQSKVDSAQRFYCTTCFGYGNPNYQYCPKCGAKMDEKDEGNV